MPDDPTPPPRRRSRDERRRYSERRAERTGAAAAKRGHPWTIGDARIALDLSLPVTEAAIQVGRTASAVESLRAKWRRGTLAESLALQVPPPPLTSDEAGKGHP
ncbi:hypothetical protein BTO20_38660 (plasmid) [Mycobacterium dioxanotrophicus]|uniref:Uncharacterized protein n=1 Tax=Mycobacterium dioxanotrophicus TaxID=482462 RepID=A0A1Y0CHQ3_9MYCO|nr:hypothetical protein [Mycobacterium dioxanotrophicus]ART74517.1 hypothetical protein BTO20_38660 [Mycobacterium dioxanotrophicus]